MKYRDFSAMNRANDGTRTLFESVVVPEVQRALVDWRSGKGGGVLIGGLAIGHYTRPRTTQDVDMLFATEAQVPDRVPGFKKNRGHAFQHDQTHVEIEIVTAEHVNFSPGVADQIIATAVESDGLKVASPAGLIASKLFRLSMQDRADIVALIKSSAVSVADLIDFKLPEDRVAAFEELLRAAESDQHP